MAKLHTILQCFVDINLELDEDSGFLVNGVSANSDLPKISFDERTYSVTENQTIEVAFSLDAPSVNGLEEVEVAIVVNNTDAIDFSTLGEVFPKTFSFSAGQQTQTIEFKANFDLLEEGSESFDVIFGALINASPGQYITTTVNIIDATNLKEVFIDEQGGVVTPGDNATLAFSLLEGSSRNIFVKLDSPSVLGVEAVDVQFSNLSAASNDYVYGGTSTLSWAIGEQTKTLSIEASADDEIESDENLKIELANPVNANTSTFTEATLTINDASPEARYATINLQGSYIQKGDYTSNVQARYIRRNTAVSYSDTTWAMFLRFGDPIEQDYYTFNPPSSSSFAPVCGEGCIQAPAAQLQSFQQDNKMFFGQNPVTEEYGDFRLRIKNVGTYPAQINGTTIGVNDSITVDIDELEYKFKLPANNVLLAAGTFYEGSPLSEDTLTQCLYEFTFEIDYDGLNFVLRDSDNSVSGNKEFNLGTHQFVETYISNDADLPQNQHMLVCEYANVFPYWESANLVFPNTSPYCLPAAGFGQDLPYPTSNATDLQNVYIDGIMFMHQTAQNQNSTSTTKSEHVGFYFWPSGQTAVENGCDSRNIQDPTGVFAPILQTTSIPFQVIV